MDDQFLLCCSQQQQGVQTVLGLPPLLRKDLHWSPMMHHQDLLCNLFWCIISRTLVKPSWVKSTLSCSIVKGVSRYLITLAVRRSLQAIEEFDGSLSNVGYDKITTDMVLPHYYFWFSCSVEATWVTSLLCYVELSFYAFTKNYYTKQTYCSDKKRSRRIISWSSRASTFVLDCRVLKGFDLPACSTESLCSV